MKKLLTNMDKKVAVTTSLEDTKAFLDSMCSQIMRIKEIKADLHRQFVHLRHAPREQHSQPALGGRYFSRLVSGYVQGAAIHARMHTLI